MTVRRKRKNEEVNYWTSYSDMMAALLLVFVLIISLVTLQAKKSFEESERELADKNAKLIEQQGQLDALVGVKSNIVSALKLEFSGTNLSVSVDSQTGAITFASSILFEKDKYDLKEEGYDFLKEFLPRYFDVILGSDYKDYISEVIIEGHTDTEGEYLYNLELSQKRALSVANYCLKNDELTNSSYNIDDLRKIVTANGKSFSNPKINEDGSINMEASRRVEFKFRMKDDEMIDQMINILEG